MPCIPDFSPFSHVVGRRGLECDPKKIEDVKSWPVPDCLKSVRHFLGFVGYYRRFIPRFADLAEPLVALTGKDVPFVWRPECAAAFLQLRDALVRAPILAFHTESGDYILDTDASNFGLGGVLSKIMRSVSSPIAAAPSVHPSGSTAPRRERCWQLYPCVCSFACTCAVQGLQSGRITNLLFGSIGLKTHMV